MTPYIICAAVWYKDFQSKEHPFIHQPKNVDRGIVVAGRRHHNAIYTFVFLSGVRSVESECGKNIQGFLTSDNRFVDREEGGRIAFAAGQTKELKAELFSEDIY